MSPKKIFKLIVFIVLIIFSVTSFLIWKYADIPLVSPITSLSTFSFLAEPHVKKEDKVIYGFLPYWNINKATIQKELTHLGYFSLRIQGNGELATTGDDDAISFNRLQSEEFLAMSEQVIEQGGAVELVLTQFNAEDITSFLQSKKAQENTLQSIDAVLLAYPFTGINIDIELASSASPQLRQQMSEFVKLLNAHLDSTYSNVQLSIDVYASAAQGSSLWDIETIAQEVDYIIIMAYDFHQRNSPQAGPVAPLFGGNERWDSDINNHLQEFIQKAPPSKLLLGIPFYGYEWQTTSRDSQSHTFPDTGSTASIQRVSELLNQKELLEVEEGWNEDALSPYLSYSEDGELYVIYFENSRSLSYKLDYVNQLGLGGIAIWALGYEGNSRDLWEVIERKIL